MCASLEELDIQDLLFEYLTILCLFIYLFYFFIHIVPYTTLDLSNYALQNYNTCTCFQTVTIIKQLST